MIKVAILGGSGYAGGELLRYLLGHPAVDLVAIASRSQAGGSLGLSWPQFRQMPGKCFFAGEMQAAAGEAQVVFAAMAQGEAMALAPQLAAEGKILIDLGAEFRFRNPGVYEEWYKRQHACPSLTAGASYGLTELYRDEIKKSRIIGNPGCYPTASLLALAPLLRAGAIEPAGIVIDAKSGYSGAGRQPAEGYQLTEATENFRAYGLPGHRHIPEIEQALSQLAGESIQVTFVPHLVPMARGLFVTAYAQAKAGLEYREALGMMADFYAKEQFVTVLREDDLPATKAVSGTNHAQIALRVDARSGRVIILAAIDNLGKGAAGQAVQNMNLILGLPEETGLSATAIFP